MPEDPTEALKEFIQSHVSMRDGVQAVLDHQREALGSDQEAHDAPLEPTSWGRCMALGQMYGSLRQTNLMLAAVEEVRQARDINWWWLLCELGWGARETAEDIP